MALREAHSGSTVSNQAGPVGLELSVGDIKGLGKKERGRRRCNKKGEVRRAFKMATVLAEQRARRGQPALT